MLSVADQQFVQEHLHDDLHRLLLSAHRYPGVSVPAAVAQIEALRKVRLKIPAWFRFDLDLPPLLSVEQASSEQTARFKAAMFSGKKMADLTGGMGVDAYFFAQQFEQVVYVERNPDLVAAARHNFAALGAANIGAVEADAADFLAGSIGMAGSRPDTAGDRYDLIFLDPARRDDRQKRVFRLEDCEPNVLSIKELLLERADRVLLKTAPMLDLNLAAEQLQSVSRIWVVSVDNEVKEVLYLLEKNAPLVADIPVEAVCLGGKTRVFRFTRAEEKAAAAQYARPQHYLYEPDAAVLKAGAFKSFATRLGMAKLHPNAHLYTSETIIPGVPGRSFAIHAVLKHDRKAVREALPSGKANIAVRNFPDSPERVRQQLGLVDGGHWYLFGTTDLDGRKVLILCTRVSKTLK